MEPCTKDCTFLVFGTPFILQWNYSRCTVVVIEAYCSHTGNLTLVECSISPDKYLLLLKGYSTRRAAKSPVVCWTVMLMNCVLLKNKRMFRFAVSQLSAKIFYPGLLWQALQQRSAVEPCYQHCMLRPFFHANDDFFCEQVISFFKWRGNPTNKKLPYLHEGVASSVCLLVILISMWLNVDLLMI